MIFMSTYQSPVRQSPSMSRSPSEDVWKSARIPKSPTWPQTVLRKPASPILGCKICHDMTMYQADMLFAIFWLWAIFGLLFFFDLCE